MHIQKLLEETLNTASLECWAEESTPTPVRALGVRLHSAGLSLRETAAVLELFGVSRSHQAVFQWVHRLAEHLPDPPHSTPRRVAVDETAVQIGSEWCWLYAAIDLDSKLLLGVRLSPRRGTTPTAAFLSELKERHDLSEAELLVDGFGYLTALSRTDLSGQLEYTDRDKIEKWFQTLKMRVNRFHNTWNGGLASAQRWLAAFVHYYNF